MDDPSIKKLLKTEKNLQIRILRYADMCPGFTIGGIKEDLCLMPEQVLFLQRELAQQGFFSNVGDESGGGRGSKYMLTLEGKSRLLEFDEMVMARRNSREARWLAIAAIIISIGVGVIQIFNTQDVRVINDIIKTEVTTQLNQ